jgi:hypothetical protein
VVLVSPFLHKSTTIARGEQVSPMAQIAVVRDQCHDELCARRIPQKWGNSPSWWLVFPIELIVVSTIDSYETATLDPEKQQEHARD